MTLFKGLSGSMAGLMLMSCVTINIYFPAAAAEKAADQIIEEVWGAGSNQPEAVSEDEDEQQSQYKGMPATNIAITLLNWLVAPAQAEVNINVNSSAITAIKNKMKARHSQLKPFYNSGAIGLSSMGLISMHNVKAVALKDRNRVKGLIADENKDRHALYAEIARANGHPEWKADIQSTFARRWISNASPGWWYQQGGQWQKK